MKIYASRRRDYSIFDMLQKFCGKDIWIKVKTISNRVPAFHKINEIHGQSIFFNEVLDSYYAPNSKALDRDLTDLQTVGYLNYIQSYVIEDPISVYTTEELIAQLTSDPDNDNLFDLARRADENL